MSKKRKREGRDVDTELVQLYDKLASEDERMRTDAAGKLLKKIFRADTTTDDQLRVVLRRLFRGLCSGRKAARQGFAVALTELLDQIFNREKKRPAFTATEIIDMLEATTQPESNTTGQDERDHYFGRVFGAASIIQSGLIWHERSREQWKRLLELICHVAKKKPWLRQECGWVLCHYFASRHFQQDREHLTFTEDIINILSANKLIRTPEGVVIWLAAKKAFPHESLAKHVWKYGHPLATKDIEALAVIMRDAKPELETKDDEPQGAAIWSSKQHFAWRYIIDFITENEIDPGLINFEDFWKSVVEKNMLEPKASVERRQNGLGIWKDVIQTSNTSLLLFTLTKDPLHLLISCATNQNETYLQKPCRDVLQALDKRARRKDQWDTAPGSRVTFVLTILNATDLLDFDKITGTKTIQNTMLECSEAEIYELGKAFWRKFREIAADQNGEQIRRQKHLLDHISMLLSFSFRRKAVTKARLPHQRPEISILDDLTIFAFSEPNVTPEARTYARERLAFALEQSLKLGVSGRYLFVHVVHDAALRETSSDNAAFDEAISSLILSTTTELDRFLKEQALIAATKKSETKQPLSFREGLVLFKSFLVLDVLTGEAESANILSDIHDVTIKEEQLVPLMIEALLSLASRQSKLTRSITTLVFESVTSRLDKASLDSFTRILHASENIKGQQDMFEAGDEPEDDASGVDDVEMGSDVEKSEAEEESADDSSDTSSDTSSSGSSDEADEPKVNGISQASESSSPSSTSEEESEDDDGKKDDELVKFEAALASALGTKPDGSSSESESDADMDDEQMLALDEKLTEVFRARQQVTQKSKKRDAKEARENILNLKNRVLDMIEIFVKDQHLNPLVFELVLPMLEMIRRTKTKQIANRGCNILRELGQKCKGWNVPAIDDASRDGVLQKLKAVHLEAGRASSNAHKAVASTVSILLVKTLVHSGIDAGVAVDVYAGSMKRWISEKKCQISPSLFTDWNNWCVSAREKLTR